MSAFFLFVAGAAAGASICACFLMRRGRLRGRMLSFVAHELNTPITGLNMTVLNFLSGVFGPMPKDQEEWMRMMRGQVQRLNSLVGDLRDFLHLEFHRDLHLRKEEVDLAQLLREALEATRIGVSRDDVPLDVDVPERLPRVSADQERIFRVFLAVLAHARKFRRQGALSLKARAQDGALRVTVGFASMPPAPGQAERSLELFYPVSGNSQVLASVGVGLGLGRAIVEMHGGSMSLSIEADGRTLVEVCLPAK